MLDNAQCRLLYVHIAATNTTDQELKMSNFTQAEARKEINKIAKKEGFIMKLDYTTKNERTKFYKFECRKTGKVLAEGLRFWHAYEAAQCCELWLKNKSQ
jgi:ribosomal protein S8